MWFVSIILLNYNWEKFNKPCIDSILQQTYQNFEIIFVDNASTDNSLEEVKKYYPKEIQNRKIIIIESKENTWFAWGNNLWVQHASGKSEYICLLNNDTTVPNDRLKELVKGIESDKKLWAIGSLILDQWYEEEIKRQIFDKKKKFMLSVFGETIVEPIQKWELENGLLYTNWLSWCCVMYKKDIMNRPFEDYYFAYAEDVYLSWKIILAWYALWICINSTVNHFWSWSFGKKPSDLKLFHGNKNQIINFLIFYNIGYKIVLFPLFIIKETWHLFIWHARPRMKAKRKWWTRILKNRWKIQQTKKEIRKNRHIWDRVFIRKMYFKVSDIVYFNKQKKIIRIWLKIINSIFFLYGKLISII